MRRPTRLSVAAKNAAMMSRSHRARTVHPAASPAEDLRRTHDAWTRDLRDRLPHDSDSSDGDTPPRARAPRRRSPARAAADEPPATTGSLKRQIAGLTSAVQMLVEQQAARLNGQETLREDIQVQRELATQLHRQEQLHASMEKLLDRQRKLAQELVERDEQSRRHVQRIEAVVSSMATGEAVPDAPAAGPARAGAWDGVGAHANTMPRLAEELPFKDGLLTWTEENVGELFACIAYKHLTSVDDENDNEEAGENAREIKQAAMSQGVDGRALLHLTIEDMEKIGEAAGTVEGGGQCALSQVGHRISILNSLVAFRDAHAHEPWETVKELPLIKSQGLERKKGVAKLTEQLCKSFGVDQIRGDNSVLC